MSTDLSASGTDVVVCSACGLAGRCLSMPKTMNGFLGVSILHRYFARDTMESFFRWGAATFRRFVILLMDDPDQFNFMVFRDLPAEAALAKARRVSDDRKRGYEKSLRKLGVDDIQILQFRDFVHDAEYQRVLGSVQAETERNPRFRESLEELVERWVGGKIRECARLNSWSADEMRRNVAILFNYIVQEFAAIIYFTENGYPVEVDPTQEFRTKTELYGGHYPNLAKSLEITERGHIFAHPAGRIKAPD